MTHLHVSWPIFMSRHPSSCLITHLHVSSPIFMSRNTSWCLTTHLDGSARWVVRHQEGLRDMSHDPSRWVRLQEGLRDIKMGHETWRWVMRYQDGSWVGLEKTICTLIDSADTKNQFFHGTNYFFSLFSKNLVVQIHCSFCSLSGPESTREIHSSMYGYI